MLTNVKPGSKINIKIVKQPTSAAASKTLVRVLSKDPTVRANNVRLTRIRKKHYNPTPRGGRLYGGHLVKQPSLKGTIGEQGVIIATFDALRDLTSVERFIEITRA